MIIAVDGPAGTGKGTICKLIANRHNFLYVDTGAMYRAVALKMIRNGIKIDELDKIEKLIADINIELIDTEFGQKILLDGEDVSKLIRMPDINACVSPVSAIKIIREKLVEIQREYGKTKDIIMEGRDITTVVFPNADIKIYMTATLEERAKRRYKEFIEKGIETTYENVITEIEKRDKNDMSKEYGALKIAKDAIVVDTTEKNIEEVCAIFEEIIFCKKH